MSKIVQDSLVKELKISQIELSSAREDLARMKEEALKSSVLALKPLPKVDPLIGNKESSEASSDVDLIELHKMLVWFEESITRARISPMVIDISQGKNESDLPYKQDAMKLVTLWRKVHEKMQCIESNFE